MTLGETTADVRENIDKVIMWMVQSKDDQHRNKSVSSHFVSVFTAHTFGAFFDEELLFQLGHNSFRPVKVVVPSYCEKIVRWLSSALYFVPFYLMILTHIYGCHFTKMMPYIGTSNESRIICQFTWLYLQLVFINFVWRDKSTDIL